jgi:hypothetical protein
VRRRALAVAIAVAACACGGGEARPTPTPPPASKGLGDMAADTAWDTQVLREASNAANEVVRSAGDCDAVRPIIGEAKAKLDAAEPRLRTAAGRGSLDALHKQVAKVEDLCAGTGN